MTETPLPPEPTVLTVEYVARRLGFSTDLSNEERMTLNEAILDAQGDVSAYLGQAVVPTLYVEYGLWPYSTGWNLSNEPLVQIVSAVPETYPDDGQLTGTFTVTYYAGLDAATNPELRPIRTEVFKRVAENPDVVAAWRNQKGEEGSRRIRSASVEGQAATYDFLTPGGGVETSTGSAERQDPEERIKKLERWKRRSVYQRRGEPYPSGLRPLGSGFYR